MAGEQDIVSLGLDIKSFNAQKKKTLEDFIALFNSLEKYDGKIFNPVLGDGLSKFNTSLNDTNRLLDDINRKVSALSNAKIGIKPVATPQVKEFKDEINNATTAIKNHQNEVTNSTNRLENMGRSLTRVFGHLRTIAYILPGLGIAGIFNLAFDAIEKVVDELGIVNDGFSESEVVLAKFKQQLDLIKESADKLKTSLDFRTEIQNLRNQLEGASDKDAKIFNLSDKIEAGIELISNEQKIGDKLVKARDKIIDDALNYAKKGAVSDKFIDLIVNFKSGDRIPDVLAKNLPPIQKSIVDAYNDVVDKIKESNKRMSEAERGIGTDFLKTQNELRDLQNFYANEDLRTSTEKAKSEIAIQINKNKSILTNDKKFYDERKAAIIDNYNQEVRLADVNLKAVTDKKTDSLTKPFDIDIATTKRNEEVTKAKEKMNKELESNEVAFYQRRLLALTEISKDEIEKDAIKNEKIFQNENNTLKERLDAYKNYIADKQELVEYEANLAIQKGASKAGGLAALTQEEKERINVHRDEQRANIAADSEKQIYDIVYTSLRKTIKAVEDEIAQEVNLSKKAYTEALHDLNDQYDKRKISLTKYHEEKKKIDSKYHKQELDEQIKKDIQDLQRLQAVYLIKINQEVEYRRALLKAAKQGGNQEEIDKAQGAYDAATQAETDIRKDIKNAKDKLASDRLKREQVEPADTEKERSKWVDAAVRVEEAINKTIEKLYDQRIQMDIDMVEKRKDILDQQYENEKDAIEKSSLSQKDKLAYEIQIDAEKQALNEESARREHELRLKEFYFNKKLELANAAVNISASIIRDGLTTPKSIADAIIGAAQVATILATEPPALAKGVKNWRGGIALHGEAGPEEIRKPGEKPYIVDTPVVGYLPPGTDVIPLRSDHPEFERVQIDNSWEQTRFLANQIKKSNKEVKNIFKPNIIVDLSFNAYKDQILGKR